MPQHVDRVCFQRGQHRLAQVCRWRFKHGHVDATEQRAQRGDFVEDSGLYQALPVEVVVVDLCQDDGIH